MLPSDFPCDAMIEKRLGFRLEVTEVEGEVVSILLYNDTALPESRHCSQPTSLAVWSLTGRTRCGSMPISF